MSAFRRGIIRCAGATALRYHVRKVQGWGDGIDGQKRAFRKLVRSIATTSFGRDHGLSTGMTYEEFRRRVPVRTYEALVPYIDRCKAGEADVLWPGVCGQFALSSGTTAGPTKHIPVTPEMLKHFSSAGLCSLMMFGARTGRMEIFGGRHLFLGGSTELTPVPRDAGIAPAVAGDLSGITALNMPSWVSALLYEPGIEIARMANWSEKIQAISKRTLDKDIRVVAGIPSWLLVLSEELRRGAGDRGREAGTLREIWPGLACCIHGGVPLAPYVEEMRAALGEDVEFHEVYPASEGFVAAQDDAPGKGLRLLTHHGIFYEFIPFEDFEAGSQTMADNAVLLEGVIEGRDYVLVMTTPAGLCRYIIGDVVRFVSTDVPRLVYAGRTKLQLSAFGEHVIEKELTDSLMAAEKQLGLRVQDFHVAPEFMDSAAGRARGRHEWWIAVPGAMPGETLREKLEQRLDVELRLRNEDYDGKRSGGGLTQPSVRFVRPMVFETWKRNNGKWGGQNKMPRCRSDREIAEGLEEQLAKIS